MAFTKIVSTVKSCATGLPDTVTTDAVSTAGADTLIVVVADYFGGTGTVSDNKSNSGWTRLTPQGISNQRIAIWYTANATVGTGHTFTYSGSTLFAAIAMIAFSGGKLTSPADQQNGADSGLQAGSITPSEDNELLIAGLSIASASCTGLSIDSSFTVEQFLAAIGGDNFGIGAAYKIQTSAGAENPAWTLTGSSATTPSIASFKAGTAASAFIPRIVVL